MGMAARSPVIMTVGLVASSWLFGQNPAEKRQVKPEEVVRLWFEHWNALDGSEQATNRLLELYLPGAFHQVGPTERQVGQVWFEGHAAIRKMIDDFAKANTEITFRIQAVTAREKSAEIVHLAEGPWGGVSAAVEYAAAYTTRKDHRRWMYPGAAFFQIQDGKIRVKRELEDGWFQHITMPLPAVLTIQSGISKLRYATLMGIKKAKTKEIKLVAIAELGAEPGAATAAIEKIYLPHKSKQTQILEGDAKTAAAKLVEKLKFEARVI